MMVPFSSPGEVETYERPGWMWRVAYDHSFKSKVMLFRLERRILNTRLETRETLLWSDNPLIRLKQTLAYSGCQVLPTCSPRTDSYTANYTSCLLPSAAAVSSIDLNIYLRTNPPPYVNSPSPIILLHGRFSRCVDGRSTMEHSTRYHWQNPPSRSLPYTMTAIDSAHNSASTTAHQTPPVFLLSHQPTPVSEILFKLTKATVRETSRFRELGLAPSLPPDTFREAAYHANTKEPDPSPPYLLIDSISSSLPEFPPS